MKATRKMLKEIKSCCHHGHGASIFRDGMIMQAISVNDVIARGHGASGWDYRIAYIDNPDITLAELQDIFDEAERAERQRRDEMKAIIANERVWVHTHDW